MRFMSACELVVGGAWGAHLARLQVCSLRYAHGVDECPQCAVALKEALRPLRTGLPCT